MNEISRTTTYSGSDITVIAYRNQISLSDLQRIEEWQKEIDELERLKDDSLKEARNSQARLSTLQRDPSWIDSVGEILTSREDANKKAQNRAADISKNKIQKSAYDGIYGASYQRLIDVKKTMDDFIDNQTTQFELGSLHTISYSSFKEKFAVRTIGRTQARSYTSGPRTIAGTLIFNTMQEHELMKLGINQYEQHEKTSHPNAVMLDQIKPFNLLLIFANEYGAYSSMSLFDVTLSTEGQAMSIDQAITRSELTFLATEMLPMRSMGNAFTSYTQMINGEIAKNFSLVESVGHDSSYKYTARLDSQLNLGEIEKMRAESRGLF